MIHLAGPYLLAAALVGLGVFGIAVRRNAVLLLVGVELVLSGALVLLVTTQAAGGRPLGRGQRHPALRHHHRRGRDGRRARDHPHGLPPAAADRPRRAERGGAVSPWLLSSCPPWRRCVGLASGRDDRIARARGRRRVRP